MIEYITNWIATNQDTIATVKTVGFKTIVISIAVAIAIWGDSNPSVSTAKKQH